MDFVPPNLNITKLKHKTDISHMTIHIAAENVYEKGRFFILWRDGFFIVIQAEPWWRPGVLPDTSRLCITDYLEEHRAIWYLQEVIQTMLDAIVFDGENNWAYLVRLKDGTYRLVYKKRKLIQNCPIWTKVVELDDIELTRFANGMCWEGVYEGKDVDIFIGWQDDWGIYVSAESRGQKLVQSLGIGHYFFELEAHVSQSGIIVGIMMEALVGRCVTPADRSAVFEAIADIQQHGISFGFHIADIYITKHGVRFASASSAQYFRDPDALAEDAKIMWTTLTRIFDHMDDDPLRGLLAGSRSLGSSAFIIPRLPSPCRPMTMTREEAIIRLVWSTMMSDKFCGSPLSAFRKLHALYRPSKHPTTRRDKRIKGDNRALLPPDDLSYDLEAPVARIEPVDEPLVIDYGPVIRWRPYVRPTSKRLLLPQD